MTGLCLLLLTAAVQAGLVVGFAIGMIGISWMLWDCSFGHSAREAKAARRRARRKSA